MNKKITLIIFLTLIFMSFSSQTCFADDEITQTVTLEKKKKELEPKPEKEGERIPSRRIVCTINATEFSSPIAPEDIITYEIRDEEGILSVASFNEDYPFCQYLFNIPGNYQIRIVTDDYVYIGYVSTL